MKFALFYYRVDGSFQLIQKFETERQALDFCEENEYTLDVTDSRGGMFCLCRV